MEPAMARKGALKRRRRDLEEREVEQRRELGALVLSMYREDRLDREEFSRQAAGLAGTRSELDHVLRELGETPPPAPPPVTAEQPLSVPPPTSSTPPPAGSPPPEPGAGTLAAEEEVAGEGEDPLAAITQEIASLESRIGAAAEAGRRAAEEHATAEILALERDIEREQQRSSAALEEAWSRVRAAEERAERAEADPERQESELRSAAAAWLRGQAGAMRREAERQVQEELELLKRAKADSDRALAEMTQRSNEANARAEREREAKEKAVAEAERRLAEIEEYVRRIEGEMGTEPGGREQAVEDRDG